jgi:hypothetical protein
MAGPEDATVASTGFTPEELLEHYRKRVGTFTILSTMYYGLMLSRAEFRSKSLQGADGRAVLLPC